MTYDLCVPPRQGWQRKSFAARLPVRIRGVRTRQVQQDLTGPGSALEGAAAQKRLQRTARPLVLIGVDSLGICAQYVAGRKANKISIGGAPSDCSAPAVQCLEQLGQALIHPADAVETVDVDCSLGKSFERRRDPGAEKAALTVEE